MIELRNVIVFRSTENLSELTQQSSELFKNAIAKFGNKKKFHYDNKF